MITKHPAFVGGPPAAHVEINNGVQTGPTKITGAAGTWFDVKNWGFMCFWVDVVDTEGNRLTVWDGRRYDEAIVQSKVAAADWDVEIHDNTE